MPIDERLQSIMGHIEDAYDAIDRKNGTLPAQLNLANLADAIDSIQTGGGEVVPADVKLFAPSLSFGTFTETNNPLIITNSQNGSFVQNYDIYSSNTLLVTIAANTTSNTINLRSYFSTDGRYTIRVIAKNSSMQNSDAVTIDYRYGTYVTVNKTVINGTITDNATETTIIGDSYHATITPNTGYSFIGASVSVIMDGVDVTSTAYNGKYGISIARIEGDITINVTFVLALPIDAPEISLNGDILTITPVAHAESYMLRLNGNDFFDVENVLTGDLSEFFVIDGIYTLSVVAIAEEGYANSSDSDPVVYSVSGGEVPDSILENNSWPVIRIVSMLGDASNYWSLGDTKTDVGEDGNTRTFRICDMQGLYGKHVVFEQVEAENDNFQYNNSAQNDYSISKMRTVHLPLIMTRYSNELQNTLTDTTYKVVKDGGAWSTVLLELTDKLFLPAVAELHSSGGLTIERNNLTQFQYYVGDKDMLKYKLDGSYGHFWFRSPSGYGNGSSYAYSLYNGMSTTYSNVASYHSATPFFSF